MAKKKSKSKSLLPKRIAGVKIPKQIRRGAIGRFLSTKQGQRLMAETLLVAGAAVAGRESAPDSTVRRGLREPADALRRTGARAADAAADGAETATIVASRLPAAFAEASRVFRETLGQDRAEELDWTVDEPIPEEPPVAEARRAAPAKKKQPSAGASRAH